MIQSRLDNPQGEDSTLPHRLMCRSCEFWTYRAPDGQMPKVCRNCGQPFNEEKGQAFVEQQLLSEEADRNAGKIDRMMCPSCGLWSYPKGDGSGPDACRGCGKPFTEEVRRAEIERRLREEEARQRDLEELERQRAEAERLLEERRRRIEEERAQELEQLRQWEESRAYYRGLRTILIDSLGATEHGASAPPRLLVGGEVEKRSSSALVQRIAYAIQEAVPGGEEAKLAYLPESKQLVIEHDLLSKEAALDPLLKIKVTEQKFTYASIVAQVALAIVNRIFKTERPSSVDSVVFNGHVRSIDPATGHEMHPCIVSLRATRDVFERLNLRKVDPVSCLKGLNAAVSQRPDELVPVRPILEFSMVDERFVEDGEILSSIDRRINLMDLTPNQFESLISELFSKMGLETRQTRPSRDGGVDCVAYDQRPILGGKVIIQAKRYKNTVGVSAVRDLYGTLQNEGGSKGILVTTSGYGKASFEFAANKPLELLSGSHLLYLLKEHAGIEARIVVPEDWKDPQPDMGE